MTVDGQFQFLGYRSSAGELIVLIVITFVVSLLTEPLRRWISDKWGTITDKISSMSDSRRAKQIHTLELKVKSLNEYSDRQFILRSMLNISRFIALLGLTILVLLFSSREEIFLYNAQMWDFLRQIWAVLGIMNHLHEDNSVITDLTNMKVAYGISYVLLIILLILSYSYASVILSEMGDFLDPQKAIRRLEERIKALRK
jgi:hypothetical protein